MVRGLLAITGTVLILITGVVLIRSCNTVVNDTGTVLRNEVGPIALNEKYKWFKDAWAQLDSKKATINQLEGKIKRLQSYNKDTPRNQWAKSDIESNNQWETERDAVVASYNDLAAQYNSAMSKFHTAFMNIGKMPQVGTDGEIPVSVRQYFSGE